MAASLRNIDHVIDLLDRLRLDADARRRGAVIVEGSADESLLAELIADEAVSFFPVAGRRNVLEVADRLGSNYLEGVICVADTDFDDEFLDRAHQWYLVFTDNADIEAMVYASAALERVLDAWASSSKLAELGGVDVLRQRIGDVVHPVSVLRRESFVRGLHLHFDAIDFYEILDRSTLTLNATGLADRLSRASSVSSSAILAAMAGSPPVCPHTEVLLIRGRDCLRVVDVALRKLIGTLSHQQVKDGLAERSVMLAIRASDLAASPFIRRLRATLKAALPA